MEEDKFTPVTDINARRSRQAKLLGLLAKTQVTLDDDGSAAIQTWRTALTQTDPNKYYEIYDAMCTAVQEKRLPMAIAELLEIAHPYSPEV